MRKALTFLAASLCLAWVTTAFAQNVPDPTPASAPELFKDVPPEHWAYSAVDDLQKKGVVVGYPDGYFRGKRTLTRYEFAIALKRALDWVWNHRIKGDKGDAGVAGEKGADGAAGKDGSDAEVGPVKEDIAKLQGSIGDIQKLAEEFKKELGALGQRVDAVEKRLGGIAKDVKDLKEAWGKAIKISGQAYMGVRTDRASGAYADRDGNTFGAHGGANDLRNSAVVVHQLEIGLAGKVGSTGTVDARIVTGNYNSFLYNDQATTGGINVTPASDTYLDRLEIKAPFSALGNGGSLTIGRITTAISPLTLSKPTVDRYFSNPIVDDGLFRMDGVNIGTKLGSVGLSLFAGQTKSVQVRDDDGSSVALNNPAGSLTQVGGLNLTLPVRGLGEGGQIRATVFEGTYADGDNLAVVGAGAKVKLSERVGFNGEWSKTLVGTGKRFGNVNSDKNNAFIGDLSYSGGSAAVGVGYKYIDPLFYAPGYWGWIGSSMNTTNIQGPTVKASLDLSPSFGLNVGGGFYKGARNYGGVSTKDLANQILAGVRWDISNTFKATLDWEGVYYEYANPNAGGSTKVHPTESYLTLGTGYVVNEALTLKLGYQMGTVRARSFGTSDYGNILGDYSYNVFTTQVSVKF